MKIPFFMGMLVSVLCCNAMQNQEDNLFEKLARKAEEEYQKNTAEKNHEKQEGANDLQKTSVALSDAKKQWDLMSWFRSESKPILEQYKPLSPEWFRALFGPCKGCEDPNQIIYCKKLLKNNPAWQEVKPLSPEVKQIVMQYALDSISNEVENGPCYVACAVCVGGDPNERLSNTNLPHTALHLVSGMAIMHHGLFLLLLKKGADPNMLCIPAHPLDFNILEKWKDELRRYGAKLEEEKK